MDFLTLLLIIVVLLEIINIIAAIVRAYYKTKIDIRHQELLDLLRSQDIDIDQPFIEITLKGKTSEFYFTWPIREALKQSVWTVEINNEIQNS